MAFPVSVHGNLTTGLLELYHDASKNRNCSIELFQCFTVKGTFGPQSVGAFFAVPRRDPSADIKGPVVFITTAVLAIS
jgi:hypothetical protein